MGRPFLHGGFVLGSWSKLKLGFPIPDPGHVSLLSGQNYPLGQVKFIT